MNISHSVYAWLLSIAFSTALHSLSVAEDGLGLDDQIALADHTTLASSTCGSACDRLIGNAVCDSCQTTIGACDVCGACRGCGGCSCGNNRLYLGVEAVFLAPIYNANASQFTLVDVVGNTGLLLDSTLGTVNQLNGSPRLTLGFGGIDGFGIQGRYWDYNGTPVSQGLFIPAVPPATNFGEFLGGTDTFDAYTVDLEGTKQLSCGLWNLFGTLGVRYAELEHARSESAFGFVNGSTFALAAQQGESFHGTGVTSSLSALRSLKCNPCLAWYGGVRSSALCGRAEARAITSATFNGSTASGNSVNGAIDFDDNETMFITELQAGLQFSRYIRSFNGRSFARAGFEYQFWNTLDDQFAAAGSFVERIDPINGPISQGLVETTSGPLDFDLIGFSIMTGFVW